jgi:hypothetical protein
VRRVSIGLKRQFNLKQRRLKRVSSKLFSRSNRKKRLRGLKNKKMWMPKEFKSKKSSLRR